MNIFEKLSTITAELNTVAKNLTVQQTKTTSYKAVSERDILDAVKPLESKYGIYSYPVVRKILESNLLETENVYKDTKTKKTTFMTRMETIYRFVNVENPEEYIETTVFSEGIDSQDKGSGKAMTYADKYALMKAYKISTGDDPDQPNFCDEQKGNTYNKPDKNHLSEFQYDVLNKMNPPVDEFVYEKFQKKIEELTIEEASRVINYFERKKNANNHN